MAGRRFLTSLATVRVDQAWGLFQISGAIHDNHAGYFQGANVNTSVDALDRVQPGWLHQLRSPCDAFGGAVEASLQIKNIPTGPGDDIKVDGSWSLGASKYVLGTAGAPPFFVQHFERLSVCNGHCNGRDLLGSEPWKLHCRCRRWFGLQRQSTNALQLTRGWGFAVPSTTTGTLTGRQACSAALPGSATTKRPRRLYCNTYVANAGVAIAGGGVTHGCGTRRYFRAGVGM